MKKYLLLIGILILTIACNIGRSAPTTATATLPSPPAPATTTPTFIPAPTNTPVPELYFTDEFDAASLFWKFLQTGGAGSPQVAFESGALRINLPTADTWYIGLHNAYRYSDVFVRAKVSASSIGSVGLICRYDESNGWFEFNIDSGGTYSVLLGQWLAPGIAKYIPVVSSVSNQIQTGNVNAELGLFCEGNFLSLYVNDTVIRRVDVTNYGLTEGNVGIAVASYRDAPMSAIFDWVKVSAE
ncbi:MAG: hypothetical protein IPO22_14205 [Anaerolineales bacterium]|nr:hypothetical protein [Anaerolineales bacterium]